MEQDAALSADRTTTDPAHACLLALLASRRAADGLAAAREFAAAPGFDWDALHESARREALLPLLCRIVQDRGLLPAEMEDLWRGGYASSLRRNWLLLNELEAVLSALRAAGLAPILLKGAALVRTVYGDEGLRPMADVDLLIREAEAPVAARQLASLGYAVDPAFCYFGAAHAHGQGRLTGNIDLHWSLIALPHYQQLIPLDWLWETARPITTGGASGLVLGPEAQVLHLCAHIVLQHRQHKCRLLWLEDVAEVLQWHREEIDWDDLLQRAGSWDLVLPLQEVLPFVAEALAAPVPGPALRRLAGMEPSPQERQLYRRLVAAPTSSVRTSWVSLAGLPDWGGRLRYLAANIFPPIAYMRYRYQIHHPALLPLAYARRWLAGLARGFTLAANMVRRRTRTSQHRIS